MLFQSVQESSSAVSRSKTTASYLGMAGVVEAPARNERDADHTPAALNSLQAALLVLLATAAWTWIVAPGAAERLYVRLAPREQWRQDAAPILSRLLALLGRV